MDPPLPIFLLILGLLIILLDMMVTAFITPIGGYLRCSWNSLRLRLELHGKLCRCVDLRRPRYILVGRYIRKDVVDIGGAKEKKYTFDPVGKRGGES